MNDFFKLTGAILSGMTSPPEVVNKTEIKGVIVSTVNTIDMGYETAILDSVNAYPVERYENEEKAKIGHEHWVKMIEMGIKRITRLGYGDSIPNEDFDLVPNK